MTRIATVLALFLVLLLPATAFAHHTDSYDGERVREAQVVKTNDIGPRGDPLYRFVVVVKNRTTEFTSARICLPTGTANWIVNKTGTVKDVATDEVVGTLKGSGDCINVAPGTYRTTWDNGNTSDSTGNKTVGIDVVTNDDPVRITLHTVRTNRGYVRTCYDVPAGSKLKTPWLDLRARSFYSMNADGEKVIPRTRVAPLGWYAAPWRGLQANAGKFRVDC